MLNDVTFGQYYPAKSFVHNMDPRAKIVLVIAFIVAIFLAKNFFGLAAVFAALVFMVLLSRVPFGRVLRSIKMILFVIVFTAVLNLFFYAGESAYEPLVDWWIFTITYESVVNMVFLALRLFLLVMGTSILTLTTTPVALTDGIESLLTPLKWIRFPVHELALIMSIALRFIPTLTDETNRIIAAQKARGADFESSAPRPCCPCSSRCSFPPSAAPRTSATRWMRAVTAAPRGAPSTKSSCFPGGTCSACSFWAGSSRASSF